jgi:hypothetical protein
VLKFLWGVVKGFFLLLMQLFCCRRVVTYVTDEELCQILTQQWACFLPDLKADVENKEWKCDLSLLQQIPCEKETPYSLPALVLFFNQEKNQVLRIEHHLKESDEEKKEKERVVCYTPDMKNQDAWKLAKMYALSNAQFYGKFMSHPFIHFIQNVWIVSFQKHFCFNLKESNDFPWFVHLIQPHMEFVLTINDNVLLSKRSVLNKSSSCCSSCWDIDVVSRKDIGLLFQEGEKHMQSYLKRAPIQALQPYYNKIQQFVLSVANRHDFDKTIHCFAKPIRSFFADLVHYAHFPPSLNEIDTNSKLASEFLFILAEYIFNVTIRHAFEHEALSHVDVEKRPQAIAIPLTKDVKLSSSSCCCCYCFSCCCRSASLPVLLCDNFKQRNFQYMFTEWTNNWCCYDTRWVKTKYQDSIANEELQSIMIDFLVDNDDDENRPKTQLDPQRIPKSIEW